MQNGRSRVTIHMAASLDGFIARRDGRVDWLETSDTFERGDTAEVSKGRAEAGTANLAIGDQIKGAFAGSGVRLLL